MEKLSSCLLSVGFLAISMLEVLEWSDSTVLLGKTNIIVKWDKQSRGSVTGRALTDDHGRNSQPCLLSDPKVFSHF